MSNDEVIQVLKQATSVNAPPIEKQIEFREALKSGRLEWRFRAGYNIWQKAYVPSWDWLTCVYRVKPEPKEIWVNEYPDKVLRFWAHEAKQIAEQNASGDAVRKAVRYREVVEE